MKQYIVDMNQMGTLQRWKREMVVCLQRSEEQRQLRLTLMDANPESW